MHISYNGLGCFTLKGKTADIVTDPFDPKVAGVALKKLKADIVTFSRENDPFFSKERVATEEAQPVVVDWPGEYEYKQVSIIGTQTWENKKGEKGGTTPNTVFSFSIDDIHVCHLGKLGHALSTEQLDELGEVDVLLLPVGGMGGFTAAKALETVEKIEPRILIPMYYRLPDAKEQMETLESFLKLVGSAAEKMESLKLTKRDLPSAEETKTIVLEIR